MLNHHLHNLGPCHTIMGQKHTINGEMQQTGHIIKYHCHLPKGNMEARCLLMPPLCKCKSQPMVNLAVTGILQPLKTGGSQSTTPPPCFHHSLVLFIMYRVYLFPLFTHFKFACHCKN